MVSVANDRQTVPTLFQYNMAMSTPVSQRPIPLPSSPTTPGSWRHPRADEISRRRNVSTFSDQNIKKALWNVGAGGILYFFNDTFHSRYDPAFDFHKNLANTHRSLRWLCAQCSIDLNPSYLSLFIFGLLLFNIATSFSPLIRPVDQMTDIPLTPQQRKLLGLDPSLASPATPQSQYVTPPRYPRSATPQSGGSRSRSGSPGLRSISYSGSPLAGKGSLGGRNSGGSPSTQLAQKIFGNSGFESTRRSSYGSPMQVGRGGVGSDVSLIGIPTTPTPIGGAKGPSVGLTNKYMYERTRHSPGPSFY